MTRRPFDMFGRPLALAWALVFAAVSQAGTATAQAAPNEAAAPEPEPKNEGAPPETAAPASPEATPPAVVTPPSEAEPAAPAEPAPAASIVPAAPAERVMPAAETPPGAAEPMIVTGSRIKRTSFAPAAAVDIIDRKQLEYSGARNLGDVVRYITAAGGSDWIGSAQAAAGTTAVNLRGLGTPATLVLVNGRRIMPSAGGFGAVFYDLNLIPMAAVERIEVLRGGASAIYGSDAIAGVVNIITKRDWEGLHVEVGGEVDDSLTYHDHDQSVAIGGRGENYRLSLGLSHTYRSRLLESDRSWTRGHVTDVLGNPASFYVPSRMGIVPDPNCAKAPGSKVNAQGFCTYDFGDQSDIMPQREQLATYGSAEYDLTKHTTLFSEVSYSRMRGQQTITPSFGVLPQVVVPANHVDNPFGQDVYFVGRLLPASVGASATTTHDDAFRGVLGLRGDFEGVAAGTRFEDWTWELSGTHAVDTYGGHLPEEVIVDNLREALASCSDRKNLSKCFNPFYSAYTGTGTPNSQAVINHVLGRLIWSAESSLSTADAGITGSLFELPGGDAKLALGTQYRHEARFTNGDHDASELGYGFFAGFTEGRASRNVSSGYAELSWPFLHGLELNTAGRVEHHQAIRTSLSPGAGLVLTPSELAGRDSTPSFLRDLHLRGQVTRAFRAPSLYESYPGFSTSIAAFHENGVDEYRAVRAFGSPDVKPETALVFTGGLLWSPIDWLALTGEYWIYDYRDKVTPASAVQIFNNNPNDPRVRRDSTGNLLGVDVQLINAGKVTTDGFDAGATATAKLGGGGKLSFGLQGTYVMRYEIPRDQISNVTLNSGKKVPTATCTASRCEVAGGRNFTNFVNPVPRLRFNVPVTFEYEGHQAAVIGHFIGPLADDENPDKKTGTLPQISSFTTVDLQYGYTIKDWIGKSTTFRVGVINLFDADPPAANTVFGWVVLLHDPRGRMVYARLIEQF